MKKFSIVLLSVLGSLGTFAQELSPVVSSYIQQYRNIAITEMQRTGVPAAITLAQGIHETQAGQSDLVVMSNNHFGIKCKSNWTGETVTHDDDRRGECFRKYNDAEQSYRDHSDFLRDNQRYAFLFELDPTDYKEWAKGLKKAGYATNPKYPDLLIKLIEDYQLEDYTLIAMGRMDLNSADIAVNNDRPRMRAGGHGAATTVKAVETSNHTLPDYPAGIFKINGTQVLFVAAGTAFLPIAMEHDLPLAKLFEYNDMDPADIATTDQLIFLQRKRKQGDKETHWVVEGETLYQIAQQEGIRLENLLKYNQLTADMQPAAGETLSLRGPATSRPRLNAIFAKSK